MNRVGPSRRIGERDVGPVLALALLSGFQGLNLCIESVPSQQIRQVLRKRRTRHHHIAACLNRFGLQISLQVREEADDRGAALQFGLDLGNQREGLGVGIIEIENDQRWPLVFAAAGQLGDRLLIALHKADLDAQLSGSLLDFRQEKQVFDEAIDSDWGIFPDWSDHGLYRNRFAEIAVAVTIAAGAILHRGGRTIRQVAVGDPITMIHRSNEYLLSALLALATTTALIVSLSVGAAILLKEPALAGSFLLLALTGLG